jgi:hypothetical protein
VFGLGPIRKDSPAQIVHLLDSHLLGFIRCRSPGYGLLHHIRNPLHLLIHVGMLGEPLVQGLSGLRFWKFIAHELLNYTLYRKVPALNLSFLPLTSNRTRWESCDTFC